MDYPIVGVLINSFEIAASKIVKDHVMFSNYSYKIINTTRTYHEYEKHLPNNVKTAIKNIKNGKILDLIQNTYSFDNNVETIDDMNEIYISCIGAQGSDKVFESVHVDDPFYLLPFCKVLRTIVSIQGNSGIRTVFPSVKNSYTMLTNEFIAFDYNCQLHYIKKDANSTDNTDRITLKLHYIVTPKFLPTTIVTFYKALHIKYNTFMRTLFLKSQENNGLSIIINKGTESYSYFLQHIGYWNLCMIVCTLYYITR